MTTKQHSASYVSHLLGQRYLNHTANSTSSTSWHVPTPAGPIAQPPRSSNIPLFSSLTPPASILDRELSQLRRCPRHNHFWLFLQKLALLTFNLVPNLVIESVSMRLGIWHRRDFPWQDTLNSFGKVSPAQLCSNFDIICGLYLVNSRSQFSLPLFIENCFEFVCYCSHSTLAAITQWGKDLGSFFCPAKRWGNEYHRFLVSYIFANLDC
jgi:hypothetical protein